MRFFSIFFISLIKPIWASDKQVKMVSLKIHFRGDVRKISDSALTNTARSQTPRWLTVCRVRLRSD